MPNPADIDRSISRRDRRPESGFAEYCPRAISRHLIKSSIDIERLVGGEERLRVTLPPGHRAGRGFGKIGEAQLQLRRFRLTRVEQPVGVANPRTIIRGRSS